MKKVETVRVPKLLMRTALPNRSKPQLSEKRYNFTRLQDWHLAHGSCHVDGLRPNELTPAPRHQPLGTPGTVRTLGTLAQLMT